jgi:hypothetical protein
VPTHTVTRPVATTFPASPAGLHAALHALGATPAAVAATLDAGGYRGCRGSAARCPIADYLTDVIPDALLICVGDTHTSITMPDRPGAAAFVEIEPPQAVADFITTFDAGGYAHLYHYPAPGCATCPA